MSSYPRFISVEGVDGVGKTTCVNFISEYLQSKGFKNRIIFQTKETNTGKMLRDYIQSEKATGVKADTFAFLFCGSINETIEEIINPCIKEGLVVITDRYTLSTRVYQSDAIYVNQLCNMIEAKRNPDLILLLDSPPTISTDRIAKRDEHTDIFETESIQILNQRRKEFLKLARDRQCRTKIIDASDSLEIVKERIKKVLDAYFVEKTEFQI